MKLVFDLEKTNKLKHDQEFQYHAVSGGGPIKPDNAKISKNGDQLISTWFLIIRKEEEFFPTE